MVHTVRTRVSVNRFAVVGSLRFAAFMPTILRQTGRAGGLEEREERKERMTATVAPAATAAPAVTTATAATTTTTTTTSE